MGQLVDAAREAYDLVIIEVPPMAAVVDYKMIARTATVSSLSSSGGKRVSAWSLSVSMTLRRSWTNCLHRSQ
jgi:Mrp family chromosome partitioning ATPase